MYFSDLFDRILKSKLFTNIPLSSNSTSFHVIKPLEGKFTILTRSSYLLLNFLINHFPKINIDRNTKILDFKITNLKLYKDKIIANNSPSRMINELFWIKFPWMRVKEELSDINILSTGCGSGAYGERLLNYSNSKISHFTGIDILEHPNWKILEEKYDHFKFFRGDSKEIFDYIPKGTNFFITQSALEHFSEDLTFFKEIRDYIKSTNKNIIQIHTFPSRVCLHLYRFHGIRQYTLPSIAKITNLFKDFSYSVLYNLGGDYCNYLHYKYLTNHPLRKKTFLRDLKPDEYRKLLYLSIKKDMMSPQQNPNFYALIIHSNYKNKIV